MRTLLLLALAPLASAQFALYTAAGASVGPTFQFPNTSVDSNQDVKFSIRPTGPSSVEIDTITVSGAGFSILSINSTLPNQATSALSLDFIVRFNAPIAAQFNASLQINGVAVTLLLATAVATPVLTAVTGCTLNSQNGRRDGGGQQEGDGDAVDLEAGVE